MGAYVEYRSIDIADRESPLESTMREFNEKYPIDLLIDMAGVVASTQGSDPAAYWTSDAAYR
jgi:short-subunit dehydrogenase